MESLGYLFKKEFQFFENNNKLVGAYAYMSNFTLLDNQDFLGCFSMAELFEAGRFTNLSRRSTYLNGRYIAKKALQVIYPCLHPLAINIETGILEDPVLSCDKNLNMNISISHTQYFSFAAVISSLCPIGVDVEMVFPEYIDEFMTLSSQHEISITKNEFNEADIVAAIRLWTLKEALSKALKTGFTLPTEYLRIDSFIKKNNTYVSYKNFPQYHGTSFIYKDHIFSICLPATVEINKLSPPKTSEPVTCP